MGSSVPSAEHYTFESVERIFRCGSQAPEIVVLMRLRISDTLHTFTFLAFKCATKIWYRGPSRPDSTDNRSDSRLTLADSHLPACGIIAERVSVGRTHAVESHCV